MASDRRRQVWESLSNEEYRREFSDDVGTGLAFQIRLLRERRGWTQEQLAQHTGKKQETISQWENPGYGSYTLNSLKSLAAAFDVALLVKFAPFSELVDWHVKLGPERLAPPSFTEERDAVRGTHVFSAEPIFAGVVGESVWMTADQNSQVGGISFALSTTGQNEVVISEEPIIGKKHREHGEREIGLAA